jgi:hypothetical protein
MAVVSTAFGTPFIAKSSTQDTSTRRFTKNAEEPQFDDRCHQRTRIILLAFEGLKNEEVSAQLSMNPDHVGVWRNR